MSKIKTAAFFVALFAFSAAANAVTYKWQSQNYSNADAPYTTSMRVEASITLAVPLASNLSASDITADIQSWTFSDGVNVFTESNSSFSTYSSVLPFKVTTDNGGSILSASFALASPDPDQPNQTGNRFKIIYTSGSNPLLNVSNDAVCTDNNSLGGCGFDDGSQEANGPTLNTSATGPWTTVVEPSVAVPAMPTSAVLALILLLGFLGFRKYRVNVQ